MKEQCWKIEEKRPIEIQVKRSVTRKKFLLIAPPMAMKYETAEKLGDNIRTEGEEDLKRINSIRKRRGLEPVERCNVSQISYNYKDGKAEFSADTMDDVKQWEKKYSDIVKLSIKY